MQTFTSKGNISMALKGSKFNASLRIKGNVFSEESSYQQPVLDIQTDNTAPADTSAGARYIIGDGGNLPTAFQGIGAATGDIVETDGTAFQVVWDASAQGEGAQTYDKDSNAWYEFDGTNWSQSAATVSSDATLDGDGSFGSPLGLADDAVDSAKLDYESVGVRAGAVDADFSGALSRTLTHNWGTLDVMVEVIDPSGETCFVETIARTTNTVTITINQNTAGNLRVLLREVKADPNAAAITVA